MSEATYKCAEMKTFRNKTHSVKFYEVYSSYSCACGYEKQAEAAVALCRSQIDMGVLIWMSNF